MAGESAKLAREHETARRRGIIERLFTEAITGQEQSGPPAVPDREGEHAVEAQGQPLTPILVTMDQDLGIRMMGAKNMAGAQQLSTQLGVVVDLAIENDTDRVVLVPHRLMATLDVENGETPVTDPKRPTIIREKSLSVRSAMSEGRGHRLDIRPPAFTKEAGDTAHQGGLSKLIRSRT